MRSSLSRRAMLRGLALTPTVFLLACGDDDDSAPAGASTSTPQTSTIAPVSPSSAATQQASGPVPLQVQNVATGLDTPWALRFAPDGRIFVTERPGRLRVLQNGALSAEPVATVSDVAEIGEGGLMGLALDPGFGQNRWLYLYYTYQSGGQVRNRVVRYTEQGNQLALASRQVLIENIPGSSIHNGGRIAFAPDGRLYITSGDGAQSALAQDRASLAGKILRINPDGSIPTDNPFPGSPVYSYGHRNPQGLAWQPGSGRLYSTEHGPTGNDEVNIIEAGQNYGWPQVQGRNHPSPFRSPISVYETSVAPAGAMFYDAAAIPQWRGNLLFATLRGVHLHRIALAADGSVTSEERLYDGEYGRLRDVVQAPDGSVYITTSNRDGRGNPAGSDDRILRIAPR